MHALRKKILWIFKGPADGFFSHWAESKLNCINQKYLIYCWLEKPYRTNWKPCLFFASGFFVYSFACSKADVFQIIWQYFKACFRSSCLKTTWSNPQLGQVLICCGPWTRAFTCSISSKKTLFIIVFLP